MTMPPPTNPKIYHIVHVDRLPSIIAAGCLWSDAEIVRRAAIDGDMGTTMGMNSIKETRLTVRQLKSHPGLHVGQCVPLGCNQRQRLAGQESDRGHRRGTESAAGGNPRKANTFRRSSATRQRARWAELARGTSPYRGCVEWLRGPPYRGL